MTFGNYNNWCLTNGMNPGLFNYNYSYNGYCYNNCSSSFLEELGGSLFFALGFRATKALTSGSSSSQTSNEISNQSLAQQITAQEAVVDEAVKKQADAQEAYDKVVSAWEKDNNDLQTQIKTAEDNVKKYNEAIENNNTFKADIKLKQSEISRLQNELDEKDPKYAEKKDVIEQLKKEVEDLQKNLKTEAELDELKKAVGELERLNNIRAASIITTTKGREAKKALDEANADLKKQQTILSNLKNLGNMSSNIDSVDGSGIGRLLDGKGSDGNGTIRDQLAAFRKASDKLAQDPGQLKENDLKILIKASEIADAIDGEGNNDKTDKMKEVSDQLRAFAAANQDTIEMYTRILNGKATVDDIETSGYFEKQERYVGSTKMTTYNGRGANDSYIIKNGEAVKLTETRSGNMFHKVRYASVS